MAKESQQLLAGKSKSRSARMVDMALEKAAEDESRHKIRGEPSRSARKRSLTWKAMDNMKDLKEKETKVRRWLTFDNNDVPGFKASGSTASTSLSGSIRKVL